MPVCSEGGEDVEGGCKGGEFEGHHGRGVGENTGCCIAFNAVNGDDTPCLNRHSVDCDGSGTACLYMS